MKFRNLQTGRRDGCGVTARTAAAVTILDAFAMADPETLFRAAYGDKPFVGEGYENHPDGAILRFIAQRSVDWWNALGDEKRARVANVLLLGGA